VNKPVDNRREMRITARSLWIPSWIAEEPEMAARRPLRGARLCSTNALPLETGTTWGRPRQRGRNRETGPSHGYLAPAGGARRRQGQATGQPLRRGRAGPLHLIHGGALPDSAPAGMASHRLGIVGNRRNGSGDDPGPRPSTGEALGWPPNLVVDGSARHVPACGCGNAGRTVTGRRTRAHRAAGSPYRARMT